MDTLTSGQRKYLRSLAHKLDALILVGKQGVSDSLINATDEALLAHELIKVRFNEYKDEKRELLELLSERCQAQVAGLIGHVGILYKQHPEAEKRKIKLP